MSGVTGNDGDNFGNFEVDENNLQKKENKESKARGFQKFPMAVHKPGGLSKTVGGEDALDNALAQGWYADVRDVPQEDAALPDKISQMTVDQAARAVKVASAKELAAYELDEQNHANREAIITLLDNAKDALVSKDAAPKEPKPAKEPKAPKAPKG